MRTTLAHNRKKTQAIVAIASVLGISAVATLAAWTYNSYVKATVSAGTFTGVEVSLDGSSWSDPQNTGGTVNFNFATPAEGALVPGGSVSNAFGLRTKSGTNLIVPTQIKAPVAPGDAPGLTYEAYTTNTFGCSGTVVTQLIPTGSSLTSGTASTTFKLPAYVNASDSGVNICIKVTADDTLVEGAAPVVQWAFNSGFPTP